jgi:hypothetical protein
MIQRDLQVLDAQVHSSQVGPKIIGNNSQQQDLPGAVVPCVVQASASTEASCLAQEQKHEDDDKLLARIRILLAEDTMVLQTSKGKSCTNLEQLSQ